MASTVTEQIALLEEHIRLERASQIDCAALLAVNPQLSTDFQETVERCAHEITVWKDILDTLRRMNTH
jgi:hypothetical protein